MDAIRKLATPERVLLFKGPVILIGVVLGYICLQYLLISIGVITYV